MVRTKTELNDCGASLFIFSQDNPLRVFLKNLTLNPFFAGFINNLIFLNSLLFMIDEPILEDKYQTKTISLVMQVISVIFVVEFAIKIIVDGFVFGGPKTYLKDYWNILDFSVVVSILLAWVDPAEAKKFRSVLGFRALRLIQIQSKSEGYKKGVDSLFKAIPAVLNVGLIILIFLFIFGALGV